MNVRPLVAARALFLLLFATGCAGGSVAQLPSGTPPLTVSGIYANPDATPPVLEAADIAFSFSVGGGTAQGAMFLMPTGGYETQQSIYEAPLTLSRFSSDGPITQVAGQANLGSDLGTFSFSGTILNGVFTYTYTDALESGSDAAPYLTAVQARLTAQEAPSPLLGTWTLSLPGLNTDYLLENLPPRGSGKEITPAGPCDFSLPNPLGSTTLKVTVTGASADSLGFGRILSGTVSGSIPYISLPASGVYTVTGSQLDGVQSLIFDISPGPRDVFVPSWGRLVIRPQGWSPPAAAGRVTWDGYYPKTTVQCLHKLDTDPNNYLGP